LYKITLIAYNMFVCITEIHLFKIRSDLLEITFYVLYTHWKSITRYGYLKIYIFRCSYGHMSLVFSYKMTNVILHHLFKKRFYYSTPAKKVYWYMEDIIWISYAITIHSPFYLVVELSCQLFFLYWKLQSKHILLNWIQYVLQLNIN